MAYNTSNPLGSTDPRDLSDNSENFDKLANGTASAYVDRLGKQRKSFAGMESEFAAFIAASGYEFVGNYAAGITITGYQQVVKDVSGEFWRLDGATALPYTTTGAGLPEGGAFLLVGDAAIRQELNASTTGQGSDLVAHTGTTDTVTEALNKRTIYVGSVAELESLSLPVGTNVYLTQEGRAGEFVVKSGTPHSDPQKGIYIALANGNNYAERVHGGVFNVGWFGALGGASDYTTEIQAAINFAQSFGSLGGVVLFDPADYRYTTLAISSRCALLGYKNATRLIKTSLTDDGVVVGNQVSRIFGVAIDKIALAAEGSHTSGSLLTVRNVGSFSAEDMTIGSSFPSKPYFGCIIENVTQSTLSDIVLSDCINTGITIQDCVDIYVNDSRFDANGGSGVFIDTVSGVYMSQVTSYNNTGANWDINNTIASPLVADTNGFMFFTSCIGDTSATNNWEISNLRDSVFKGCWGSTQSGSAANGTGFFVEACQNLQFDSCMALNNNAEGVLVAASSTEITFTSGRYRQNGQDLSAANKCGVRVASGCEVKLESVNMNDNLDRGLKVDSGVTSLEIFGCNLTGNTGDPYLFDDIPSYFNERDNKTGQPNALASSNIVVLPELGSQFTITGTTNINGLDKQYLERSVTLIFQNALTVGDIGNLVLSGNFTTSANDTLRLESDGTNWYEISRSVN